MADRSETENTGDFRVSPDSYFRVGDNRDNSTDSRFNQVGLIQRFATIGRIMTIYWSTDHTRVLTAVF